MFRHLDYVYVKTNKTALPILHLIDVIKPDTVDFSLVKNGANLSVEVIFNSSCV